MADPTKSAAASVTLTPPSATTGMATFVALDTVTQGNWQSAYGSDGYPVHPVFPIDGDEWVCPEIQVGALQDSGFFPVPSCLYLYRPPELNHLPNGAGKARLCRAEHVSLVVETADECS